MNTSQFRRLHGGQIIFVTHVNEKSGQVYGYNLTSPNLRTKTWNPSQIDQKWDYDLPEIVKKMEPLDYYNLDQNNKYHTAFITTKRHTELVNLIQEMMKP